MTAGIWTRMIPEGMYVKIGVAAMRSMYCLSERVFKTIVTFILTHSSKEFFPIVRISTGQEKLKKEKDDERN